MPSPDEIERKTFSVTLRGFDQSEVTRFMHEVADQLRTTLERAEAADAALEAANRAAAEIITRAETEAAELRSLAERMRDEAARIRDDALGLFEHELKQAAEDSEEVRLKAVEEIEAILTRADAEVSAMLQSFRQRRNDLLGIGRNLAAHSWRTPKRGSQRQLGD